MVTVGKRATLWLHDLLLDLEELDHVLGSLKFLGSKGTTGTQANFMDLFDGDEEKCRKIDSIIAEKFDFTAVYPVSGKPIHEKSTARF